MSYYFSKVVNLGFEEAITKATEELKKQGFGVPIYEWFYDELGQIAWQEINTFCEETDFLDQAGIAALFERGMGPQLWYVLNFVLWWKEYIQ